MNSLSFRWAARSSALALFCVMALATGCMHQFGQERQLGNAAFVNFPNLRGEANAQLTGSQTYEFDVRGGSKRRYEIEAGAYRIVITRDGELLHDGKFYVSAGQVRPVEVR